MQLLACWITVDEADLPLTPRLIGSPGVGKTQLAIAAAKAQQRPLFIYQCTADTRPEDLLVTPVLSQGGEISYHASPLVSAMLLRRRLFVGRRQSDEREVVGFHWRHCSTVVDWSNRLSLESRSPRQSTFVLR